MVDIEGIKRLLGNTAYLIQEVKVMGIKICGEKVFVQVDDAEGDEMGEYPIEQIFEDALGLDMEEEHKDNSLPPCSDCAKAESSCENERTTCTSPEEPEPIIPALPAGEEDR